MLVVHRPVDCTVEFDRSIAEICIIKLSLLFPVYSFNSQGHMTALLVLPNAHRPQDTLVLSALGHNHQVLPKHTDELHDVQFAQ